MFFLCNHVAARAGLCCCRRRDCENLLCLFTHAHKRHPSPHGTTAPRPPAQPPSAPARRPCRINIGYIEMTTKVCKSSHIRMRWWEPLLCVALLGCLPLTPALCSEPVAKAGRYGYATQLIGDRAPVAGCWQCRWWWHEPRRRTSARDEPSEWRFIRTVAPRYQPASTGHARQRGEGSDKTH